MGIEWIVWAGGYMSEWCGQGSAAIGRLPIAKPSRECACRDEEIAMARVPKRARPAPIKSDRISISKALTKASADRNRCTEERKRHRRLRTCDRGRESDSAG